MTEFEQLTLSVDELASTLTSMNETIEGLDTTYLEPILAEIGEAVRANTEVLARMAEALEQGFGLWVADSRKE